MLTKSKNIFIFLLLFFIVFAFIESFLLLTGAKILKSEHIISPGEPYPDAETISIFGEYHAKENMSLICKYFNGRKTVFREFNYSVTNTNGLDSCPAYLRPRQ